MAGCSKADVLGALRSDGIHSEIEERVEGQVRRALGAHCNEDSPQRCFRDLMKGRAGYGFDAVGVTLAPFHKDRVSLPESLESAPCILDLLDACDRSMVEMAKEPLLRDKVGVDERLKEAPLVAHTDPALLRRRRGYAGFIRRLDRLGMIRWRRSKVESVGVFFVHKKDRDQIRMILDARRSNCWFSDAAPVQLLTSEGLSDIECTSGVTLSVGTADINNCFHRLVMPAWMSAYFAYPCVSGAESGKVGHDLDGDPIQRGEILFPCAAV